MTLNPTAPIRRASVDPTGDAFEDVDADTERLQFDIAAAGSSASPAGRVRGVAVDVTTASVTVPDGADSAVAGGDEGEEIPGTSLIFDGQPFGGGAAVIQVGGEPVAVAGGGGGTGVGDTDDEARVDTGGGGAPGGVEGDYDPDDVPFDDANIDEVVPGGDAESDGLPSVGGDGADVAGEADQLLDTEDGFIAFYAGEPGDAAVVDEDVVPEADTIAGDRTEFEGSATIQQEPFVALDVDAQRHAVAPAGEPASVDVEIAVRNIGLFEREFDIDVSVGDTTETVTRTIDADETHEETVTVEPPAPETVTAAPVAVAVDDESVGDVTHLVSEATAAESWVVSHSAASLALDAGDVEWAPRELSLSALIDADTRETLRELAGVGTGVEEDGALGQFAARAVRDESVFLRPPDALAPPYRPRDATIRELSVEQRSTTRSVLSLALSWTRPRDVEPATVGDGEVALTVGDSELALAPAQIGQPTEAAERRVRIDEVPLRLSGAEAAVLLDHASHAGGAVLRDRPFADAVVVDATRGQVLSGELTGTPFDGDVIVRDVALTQPGTVSDDRPFEAVVRLARDVS